MNNLPICPVSSGSFWPESASICPAQERSLNSPAYLSVGQAGEHRHLDLASGAFETLSKPGWLSWAPTIFTPALDLRVLDAASVKTLRTAAATLTRAKQEAYRSIPPDIRLNLDRPLVLLDPKRFEAVAAEQGLPGAATLIRQPDGILVLDVSRAFEADGQRVSDEGFRLLNLANTCEHFRDACKSQGWVRRLLPVRHHLDEGYLSADQSADAFADFVFKARADSQMEQGGSTAQRYADFKRLLATVDPASFKASMAGPEAGELIATLLSYTTATYAALLEEKITPLLDQPIHVADYIRRLNLFFGDAPRPEIGWVMLDFKEGVNVPRDLNLNVMDQRGGMVLMHHDVMHELVHIAANEHVVRDLPALFSGLGIRLKGQESHARDLCPQLISNFHYLTELVTEWLRIHLIQEGNPDSGLADRRVWDQPLVGSQGLNVYKASYLTTVQGIDREGESFMTDFLGKPQEDAAVRKADAARALVKLATHCPAGLAKEAQRGGRE